MKYDVNKILGNEETYYEVIDSLFEEIENDFKGRRDTVGAIIGDKTLTISKANFLTNLIIWRPFVVFNEELTEEYVLDCSNLNADVLNDYLEVLREKFFSVENKRKLNIALAEIIEGYAKLTFVFNKYIGNSISLYSFHKLAEENEEYREILDTELTSDKSSKEMEEELNYKTKRVIEILSNNENCFQDYMLCKEGVNINQLTQFMIAVGPKPDLNGNVYPIPVRRSIMRGFTDMSDYYIDATGGRKAC